MFIIGLTGGISCGKSAVACELRRLGVSTYDVDEETHFLLQPGGELYEIYLQHFGEQVIMNGGRLNKKIIGEIIFHDEEQREWINSVAHPILLNRTRQFLVECLEVGVEVVVLEVPLLFEAGWEILVDEVWAVYIPRELQIQRLVSRDKITPQQAVSRIISQMPTEEICLRADVVINNTGDHDKLRKTIRDALKGKLSAKN